jgi:hypothetical protein
MTNEPILKNAKMNINQLIITNYINPPPIGQKKTNPFPCRGEASREAGSPDPPKPVPSKLKRRRMAKEGTCRGEAEALRSFMHSRVMRSLCLRCRKPNFKFFLQKPLYGVKLPLFVYKNAGFLAVIQPKKNYCFKGV